MAIDSSIYFQQKTPDIMGGITRGLETRRQLDEDKRKKSIQDAYKEGITQNEDGSMAYDPNKTVGILAGQGLGREAYQAQQQHKAQQATDQNNMLETQLKGLDLTTKLLGGVDSPEGWEAAKSQLRSAGVNLGQYDQAPYDPNLKNAILNRSLTAKERLDQQWKQREFGLKEQEFKSKQADKTEKRQDKLTAQKANSEVVTRAGQTLIRDVTTAIDNIDKNGRWAAGIGSLGRWMPESSSNELAADIASIQGNVAVDQLLKIKKSGAGLGQVPQSQLEMLGSLLGGLRQGMGPEKLRANLNDIKEIYQDIVEAEGGDPLELARTRGYDQNAPNKPLPDPGDIRRQNSGPEVLKTNQIQWMD